MKDAMKDMAHSVAQDVAEGVSGAAEDGNVKVRILSIVIFQRRQAGSSRPSPMGTRRWLASGAYTWAEGRSSAPPSRGTSPSTPGCVNVRPPVRDDDSTLPLPEKRCS